MLRPECLRVLEVCTTLLKKCAEAGLTLYDIATVMSRPFVDGDEEPSELERMCAYARQCVEVRRQPFGGSTWLSWVVGWKAALYSNLGQVVCTARSFTK